MFETTPNNYICMAACCPYNGITVLGDGITLAHLDLLPLDEQPKREKCRGCRKELCAYLDACWSSDTLLKGLCGDCQYKKRREFEAFTGETL